MNRGEVWWINFEPSVGGEIQKVKEEDVMITETIQQQIQQLPYFYQKQLYDFAYYLIKQSTFHEETDLTDSCNELQHRIQVRRALIDSGLISPQDRFKSATRLSHEQQNYLADLFSGEPVLSDMIISERKGR